MWAKLRQLDRRLVMGVLALLLLAGLIYLSGRSARTVALQLQPLTVHLNFSDQVKKRLSETGAVLSVQLNATDQEATSSPLDATVIDHREQVVRPGEDTVQFEAKPLEIEMPASVVVPTIDPTLTLSVVTRLDQPAGNCIHCENPAFKLSSLHEGKEGENRIELKCDGWLEMGVCVWPKQKQQQK